MLPPLNPIGSWAGASTFCFLVLTIIVIILLIIEFEFRRTGVQSAVDNIERAQLQLKEKANLVTFFGDSETYDPYHKYDTLNDTLNDEAKKYVFNMTAVSARNARSGLFITAIILIHVFIVLMALAKYQNFRPQPQPQQAQQEPRPLYRKSRV